MVQSINSQVDFVTDATAFTGLTDYGKIMIGNNGFEFYHDRDVSKFIQIPWEEVDVVVASVLFKGKWIPRYGVQTKKDGTFTFSSKKPKDVLRAVNKYIPAERIVHSLSFFDVVKQGIKAVFTKKSK